MKINYQTKQELLHLLNTKKMLGIEHVKQIDLSQYYNKRHKLPIDIVGLFDYVSNCSLCELSKSKISCEFSQGNNKSEIFIIHTYLNKESQKEYLDLKNMIEERLKININDIYMTNILKCNVKKLNDNLDEEIKKCIPYLEQQIVLLKPKIIITFGNAFRYLMNNDDNITDISGNLFIYNDIKVIPLLNIDFINKNPSYKEKMDKDLEKIKNILEKK